MHKVRDWLYIGKYAHTRNTKLLTRSRITAMLQLAEKVRQKNIDTLYLPVEDGEPMTNAQIKKGVEFILLHHTLKNTILVACGAGISRSVTFAMGALMEIESLSIKDAYRAVYVTHPDAMPNPYLLVSLAKYHGQSMDIFEAAQLVDDVQQGKA